MLTLDACWCRSPAQLPDATVVQCQRVNKLKQSAWLSFRLPDALLDTDSCFDITLEAETTAHGHRPSLHHLVSQPRFCLDQGDMQRMAMSHCSGLYIWRAEGGCAHTLGQQGVRGTECDSHPPPCCADEAGIADIFREGVQLMAYVHFEQLLPSLGVRDCLSEVRGSHLPRAMAPAHPLHVFIDFHTMADGEHAGSIHSPLCRLPLPRDPLQHYVAAQYSEAASSVSCTVPRLSDLLPAEAHEASGDGADACKQLQAWCEQQHGDTEKPILADFALYSSAGKLLVGRSGVELWSGTCVACDLPTG